jgi:hypothetical protein
MGARDSEGITVFQQGETLNFTLHSEQDAHLLLLDIDSQGNICVLLPESDISKARIAKGVKLRTRDIGIVQPPLGVEFLKLFAFREKVKGLEGFVGGKGVLSPTGKEFAELLALIKRQKGWAETVQQVVTVKNR